MDIIGASYVGYGQSDVFTGDADLDRLLAMGAADIVGAQQRGLSHHPHHPHAHHPPAHMTMPGRHVEVVQRDQGVWREQYVPLNLPGGILATIGAGLTQLVSTTLQKRFRANRFILDSGVAGGFVVNDIRVGVNPQLAATGSLPGRMFTELAVNIGLHADTGDPGIQLSVSITNVTGGALPFVAGFQGIATQ